MDMGFLGQTVGVLDLQGRHCKVECAAFFAWTRWSMPPLKYVGYYLFIRGVNSHLFDESTFV